MTYLESVIVRLPLTPLSMPENGGDVLYAALLPDAIDDYIFDANLPALRGRYAKARIAAEAHDGIISVYKVEAILTTIKKQPVNLVLLEAPARELAEVIDEPSHATVVPISTAGLEALFDDEFLLEEVLAA